MRAVINSLTPDLLKPKYRRKAAGKHKTFGHCYAASEAVWHMLGGKESGYTPCVLRLGPRDTHWYLRNKRTLRHLDPTARQFARPVRHKDGKCKGFLTRRPSKRAQIIINRARARMRSSIA